MSSASQALLEAARLLTGADPKLYRIVLLSLQVSLTAVAISSMVGLKQYGVFSRSNRTPAC